ncbi:MAG TPA: hypothetical protein VFD90_04540 [Gaiellales bacterium]|jgi:hypothetical protein|nr:hypothetical protein [Gaiellales bacterium]
MARRHADEKPAAPERPRAGLLLDDLAEQLSRFRLLPGGSEADAERVLAGLTPASPREREATKELADRQILAHPDRFEDAHHLVVKALEVFDRHGWRGPRLPGWLGPLRPVAVLGVEQVTRAIVRSYARDISNSMRRLYARREAQCTFDQPERGPLARARIAMTRLAPDFGGGGGGLPRFLVGGAVLSGLVSVARQVGGLSSGGASAWFGLGAAAVLIFAAVAWIILRGAAVAHRRSRLILHEPLEALWETIGAAGEPPRDDSMTVATVGIILTAVAWFVTPLIVAAVFYIGR